MDFGKKLICMLIFTIYHSPGILENGGIFHFVISVFAVRSIVKLVETLGYLILIDEEVVVWRMEKVE